MRGFDHAASFGLYEGTLRSLIHLYKYSGMKPLARILGDYLNRIAPSDRKFDAVVPVPLHWRRQWDRGFNQSELLARHVASSHGIPVIQALKRARATQVQAGLASAGRRRNMAGAFRARNGAAVSGKDLLLIDDVLTTGATASACAVALKRAGAKSVALLTVARVDRRFT